MLGIYIHIPFCRSKCPYCDFYSMRSDEETIDNYVSALVREISAFPNREKVDSVYFGGGTPSLIGGRRIAEILAAVREKFELVDPEITVECNPSSSDSVLFETLFAAGVNRISFGMQSAVDRERSILGRVSDRSDIRHCVDEAKKAGIKNISVDLMLGVPFQDKESLLASIMFIMQLDVKHISAYMLKIEEGTFFSKMRGKLPFPDEDEVCDMYLFLCDYMEKLGFRQYEISNFAKPGYSSRHNLKYWRDEEYISFGPAAHSFYRGERYHYERDLQKYIAAPEKISDGRGGDEEEYVMLALRLCEGLKYDSFSERFSHPVGRKFIETAKQLEKYGFVKVGEKRICLTKEGFLISNTVIGELTEALE
ncbi:MAG: radical SAM family heme chaperone HemW [Acutalibacteraceae bacterium]|nr:radical SAM family heme chaperone HemW [Oscillospiraceae bacterium]